MTSNSPRCGDELWAIAVANDRSFRVRAGKILQQQDDILVLAAPHHPDGQSVATIRIDHVQEVEPLAMCGGLELEIHHQQLMRVFGRVTPNRARRQGSTASNYLEWAAANLPSARAGAPACGSPSNRLAAAGDRPCCSPIGWAHRRSREYKAHLDRLDTGECSLITTATIPPRPAQKHAQPLVWLPYAPSRTPQEPAARREVHQDLVG